jgi:hypothetical protein
MPNEMTIDNTDPHLNELKKQLAPFRSMDVEDYSPVLLGGRGFGDPYLYILADLFKSLSECEFYFLPPEEAERLTSYAREVLELLKGSKSQNPSPEGRNKSGVFSRDLYNNCFNLVSSTIAYWKVKTLDVQEQQREFNNVTKELEGIRTEATRLLRNVKETVQEVTVAQEAVHFDKESKAHKKSAYGWLVSLILLALLTFYFAWDSYSFNEELLLHTEMRGSPATINTAQALQYGISKLVLFSLLIGGLFWCGRIYRAHRHNYVVNKHRVNALGSFKTFVNSTQDPQTKNAVLLQATQCIYTPQSSGYVTQEAETGNSPHILEIVKGVAEGKAK